jgi:hypothetical protein
MTMTESDEWQVVEYVVGGARKILILEHSTKHHYCRKQHRTHKNR